MKYLIVYDPQKQETLLMESYPDTEGKRVRDRRLELELQNRVNKGFEVLVLQAADEQLLRTTHARYFGKIDLETIYKRFLT